MKLAFHVDNFSFRGTEVATYDYAHYNETLLNNTSIIVHRNPTGYVGTISKSGCNREQEVYEKFSKRFPIFEYTSLQELNKFLRDNRVYGLHTLKYGTPNELVLKGHEGTNVTDTSGTCKLLVHCVYDSTTRHGDVFASISESVSKGRTLIVPHIVDLPETTNNYREFLKIPKTATVYGRHGGSDTFNIPFVRDVILKVVNDDPSVYFLFAVRPEILADIDHPRVIFIHQFADPHVRAAFINTCDAMIHACNLGESFGLSVLEFCKMNKPVITYIGPPLNVPFYNDQHLKNLQGRGLYYKNADELYGWLTLKYFPDFNYRELAEVYTPEKVMAQFEEVFLDRK